MGRWRLIIGQVYAVFLCDHTTGCEAYSFTTDGYGIFNMRTNLGAYSTHEGGDQAQTSLQKSWLGGTEKLYLTLPRQGIKIQGLRIWILTH